MTELNEKHCVPCEGDTPPLPHDESQKLLDEVDGNWIMVEDKELEKTYVFKNFEEALAFVNKVGAIAEAEGHHPDINLHGYKKVTIRLSTHAIGGLSENDFILASKVDGIHLTPSPLS